MDEKAIEKKIENYWKILGDKSFNNLSIAELEIYLADLRELKSILDPHEDTGTRLDELHKDCISILSLVLMQQNYLATGSEL